MTTLMVQGTAGTAEEAVRYGWNYARLIAEGPSRDALVPSPVMRAMAGGQIARVEELTRMPSDVQDALITILSEKTLPVPELGTELQAVRGFNVIATANDRDRGVNDLSSALRRRFNTVVLPVPASAEQEVDIVARRVAALLPRARGPLVAHRLDMDTSGLMVLGLDPSAQRELARQFDVSRPPTLRRLIRGVPLVFVFDPYRRVLISLHDALGDRGQRNSSSPAQDAAAGRALELDAVGQSFELEHGHLGGADSCRHQGGVLGWGLGR